eukprot:scaffold459_cov391-Prasinococcus_capsulatus_cf.AAC.4
MGQVAERAESVHTGVSQASPLSSARNGGERSERVAWQCRLAPRRGAAASAPLARSVVARG